MAAVAVQRSERPLGDRRGQRSGGRRTVEGEAGGGGERLRCKKGFSKRVEEARRYGSEKEIQRDGRGRYYYYPQRPPDCCDWHVRVPKPKGRSPLSLPWHGADPCKCECSDTERSAFFTAVVQRSAVGGQRDDAAHAHRHSTCARTRSPCPGRLLLDVTCPPLRAVPRRRGYSMRLVHERLCDARGAEETSSACECRSPAGHAPCRPPCRALYCVGVHS